MADKPIIWIIDTSVFLNVLDVPGFNQKRLSLLNDFEGRISAGNSFFLPFSTIIETGNHIGQLTSGNLRQQFAIKFIEQVIQSFNGTAPWRPLGFPTQDDLTQWLNDFPNNAQAGKGLGDHLIIKQWEEQCKSHKAYIVKIWSIDNHLQGYECNH